MSVLLETNLPLPLFRRGKVRDVYDLGDKLLIVSTDRVSAFDAVLPCGIPGKGEVLNQLSAFWFEKTRHIMPNHFIKVIDTLDALQDVIARDRVPKQSLDRLGTSSAISERERFLTCPFATLRAFNKPRRSLHDCG